MTHRGSCQPRPCCDSVNRQTAVGTGELGTAAQLPQSNHTRKMGRIHRGPQRSAPVGLRWAPSGGWWREGASQRVPIPNSVWIACVARVGGLNEILCVLCPYQGEGVWLFYLLAWRVSIESLQRTLWFPGHYKSIRFYQCTFRWLLSWAVSAQYMRAFTRFSLNSPSVSKLTNFEIVCVWQGRALRLSSMQSSIQNIHGWSLPLPLVAFGSGSVLLCASVRGIWFYFWFWFFLSRWLESLYQHCNRKVRPVLSFTSSRILAAGQLVV